MTAARTSAMPERLLLLRRLYQLLRVDISIIVRTMEQRNSQKTGEGALRV
jgi:hypothetical protein